MRVQVSLFCVNSERASLPPLGSSLAHGTLTFPSPSLLLPPAAHTAEETAIPLAHSLDPHPSGPHRIHITPQDTMKKALGPN